MCNITDFKYKCEHHVQHVWSACRGRIKEGKDSNKPACRKVPSRYVKLATECGSCCRADTEQKIRRALTEINKHSPKEFELILSNELAILATQIPTTNVWRPLPSPVYTRKPSQKRVRTARKTSLLRNEFKPEDACEPEAWEDNEVLPVYEAVEDGWNYPWTAETKSLADEFAEDAERKKQEIGDDGEVEDDVNGDEDDLGGEDESEETEEKEEGAFSESPETVEAEVNESSAVKVCYRFRKTTRGRNAQARHWEMVEVWV